jgi:hypothetical protein
VPLETLPDEQAATASAAVTTPAAAVRARFEQSMPNSLNSLLLE